MDSHVEKIIEILKQHREGLSITQLNSMLDLNRNSIARYLEVLTSQGILSERIIGPAKLYHFEQDLPFQKQLEIFKLAMDVANCGITIADARKEDMPLIYVNKKFTELSGYEEAEVLGQNCRFLQGRRKKQVGLRKLKKAIEKGESCTVILTNFHKDGTKLNNKLSISPIKDSNGEVTHYVGIQEMTKE